MKKTFITRTLPILGIIVLLSYIFSESILAEISRALVHEDSLVKSEAIVVLSGSSTGSRIKAAAKLYKEGFGDKLVFSGFKLYHSSYTHTVMKDYAIKLGVPEDKIITTIPDIEISTRGESTANLELLKKNSLHTFILVTSAFHTRRSYLIYKNTISTSGYDAKFRVYPAYDPITPIQGWWKLRSGQKGILLEYLKSIAYYLRL